MVRTDVSGCRAPGHLELKFDFIGRRFHWNVGTRFVANATGCPIGPLNLCSGSVILERQVRRHRAPRSLSEQGAAATSRLAYPLLRHREARPGHPLIKARLRTMPQRHGTTTLFFALKRPPF